MKSSILSAANRQKALPYRDMSKSSGGNSSEDKPNSKSSSDPSPTKRKRGGGDPPGQFTEVAIPGIVGSYRLVCLTLAKWLRGYLDPALDMFCFMIFYSCMFKIFVCAALFIFSFLPSPVSVLDS